MTGSPQPHITDTHTWDGTHHLPDWLHHDGHRLVLPGRDDDTQPQPGWMLVRWSDGQVTVASPQVAARVYGPDGMRGRLERAEAELADRDAAESADAAAGSYAGSSEYAIADPARWLHIAFTSPDETTANTSALALRDHLTAEFPSVGMRITTNAVEGESVIVCTTACDEQHTYDWTCEQFAGISDESARTTPDNPATSSALAEQLRTAIEHEVYEYRERTMLWGETEGVTEEIARLATRGALSILQANPAPIRDLIDTALRTTPRADCADWPAREPHGQGHRYDMRCALCAGEADTLTDAVLAALQLRPEPGQPKEQP